MTPRSIRRAAERKARKEQLRKERNTLQRNASHEPQLESNEPAFEAPATEAASEPHHFLTDIAAQPKPAPASKISNARLTANRANAQLSTGPTSDRGRAKASLNAVKTALTGRTVLLASDDAALYEQHVLAYTKELNPLTQRECDLVQSIADTAWRLKRIPGLEMAIYAQGRAEFAESFENHEPSARPGMIELKTFLTYEKQLRNLQLQEARLARRYQKETAELRTIQAERDQRESVDLATAAKLYLAAKHDGKPFHPSNFGFEFSNTDIEQYLQGVRAAKIAQDSLQPDQNTKRRAQAA